MKKNSFKGGKSRQTNYFRTNILDVDGSDFQNKHSPFAYQKSGLFKNNNIPSTPGTEFPLNTCFFCG